jgi:uncharacterized protein YbaP (TraB family)
MKPPVRVLCALAAALLAPFSGSAQTLAPRPDPEGVMVEELVVKARIAGPAWWRVSNGESTVWVLGVPSALPGDMAWDEAPLTARLSVSKALILPSQARINPLQALFFFIGHRKALRSSAPLEQSLPQPLAVRFAADREGIGQPAGRYAGWKPAVAGVMLDADFRKGLKMTQGQPLGRIRDIARRQNVHELHPADYAGGELLKALIDLSAEAQADCLDDAMSEVEAGRDHALAAARGWTQGDPKAALAMERGYERCLAALPSLSALLTRAQVETAAAIAKALSSPGQAVAVVELRQLLAQDGVLERLRRQGFTVTTPDRN